MQMSWDATGRRIVREDLLLAEYRGRLGRDPIHQQRARANASDTPADELLDQLSMSLPNVINE